MDILWKLGTFYVDPSQLFDNLHCSNFILSPYHLKFIWKLKCTVRWFQISPGSLVKVEFPRVEHFNPLLYSPAASLLRGSTAAISGTSREKLSAFGAWSIWCLAQLQIMNTAIAALSQILWCTSFSFYLLRGFFWCCFVVLVFC